MDSGEQMPGGSDLRDELRGLQESITAIMGRFRRIQNPLEKTLDSVPEASQQLHKVTSTTEEATHQLLDTAENITQRDGDLIAFLENLNAQDLPDDATDIVQRCQQLANDNLNDAYVIMNALQFQDIVAQQLQHASTLLETVRSRLARLVSAFSGEHADESLAHVEASTPSHYDPNANFGGGGQPSQDEIDSLIASVSKTKEQ